jgi:hypothetical protein
MKVTSACLCEAANSLADSSLDHIFDRADKIDRTYRKNAVDVDWVHMMRMRPNFDTFSAFGKPGLYSFFVHGYQLLTVREQRDASDHETVARKGVQPRSGQALP